jgi:hypothetical protein
MQRIFTKRDNTVVVLPVEIIASPIPKMGGFLYGN